MSQLGWWMVVVALCTALSSPVVAQQQTTATRIVWGQPKGEASADLEWHFHLGGVYAFTVPYFSASSLPSGIGEAWLDKFTATVSPMPSGASLTSFACRGSACGPVSNALILPPLPTATATETATRTITRTASLTPTLARTDTPTATARATDTRTATAVPTLTAIPATATAAPTNTPSPRPPSAPRLLILEHAFGEPTIAVTQRTQTPGATP